MTFENGNNGIIDETTKTPVAPVETPEEKALREAEDAKKAEEEKRAKELADAQQATAKDNMKNDKEQGAVKAEEILQNKELLDQRKAVLAINSVKDIVFLDPIDPTTVDIDKMLQSNSSEYFNLKSYTKFLNFNDKTEFTKDIAGFEDKIKKLSDQSSIKIEDIKAIDDIKKLIQILQKDPILREEYRVWVLKNIIQWEHVHNVLNGKLDFNNLDSRDSQKAIMSLFERDMGGYKNLVTILQDPNNPNYKNAELTVKKYATMKWLSTDWLKISLQDRQMWVDTNGIQIPLKIIVLWEWDSKKIIEFWTLGSPKKFTEFLNDDEIKKLYLDKEWKIDMNNNELKSKLEKIAVINDTWVSSWWWEKLPLARSRLWFSDMINSFFDNPIFWEMKSLFLWLMAQFGKEGDRNRYQVEAAFSDVERKLARESRFNYTDRNGDNISVTYTKALRDVFSGLDNTKLLENKKIFLNATYEDQKKFIQESIARSPDQRFAWPLWKKMNGGSAEKSLEKKNIVKVKGEELLKDMPGIDPNILKKMKEKQPDWISIEIKWEWNNLYIESLFGSISPIKDWKVSIYLPSIDWNATIKKSLSVNKNENWWFYVAAIDWAKKIPHNNNLIKDLHNNDVFDMWKSLKLWNLDNRSIDKDKFNPIILKYYKEFDKLWSDQRTEENMKKIMNNMKNELLIVTPEELKESAWFELNYINPGS